MIVAVTDGAFRAAALTEAARSRRQLGIYADVLASEARRAETALHRLRLALEG